MSVVDLPRPGLVHEVCPYCYGLGEQDDPRGDSQIARARTCYACAGNGYIVREAPRDPVADLVGQIIGAAEARMDAIGIPGEKK